jgi:hypothetical protein
MGSNWANTFGFAEQPSVYFKHFLDPDQGQTGPVSWEVTPLPPPRPSPYLQSQCRKIQRALLRLLPSQHSRFPARTAERGYAGGRETTQLRPAANAPHFSADSCSRNRPAKYVPQEQVTSLLLPRYPGVPRDLSRSREDGLRQCSGDDRCAAQIACLPPLRWHA